MKTETHMVNYHFIRSNTFAESFVWIEGRATQNIRISKVQIQMINMCTCALGIYPVYRCSPFKFQGIIIGNETFKHAI